MRWREKNCLRDSDIRFASLENKIEEPVKIGYNRRQSEKTGCLPASAGPEGGCGKKEPVNVKEEVLC